MTNSTLFKALKNNPTFESFEPWIKQCVFEFYKEILDEPLTLDLNSIIAPLIRINTFYKELEDPWIQYYFEQGFLGYLDSKEQKPIYFFIELEGFIKKFTQTDNPLIWELIENNQIYQTIPDASLKNSEPKIETYDELDTILFGLLYNEYNNQTKYELSTNEQETIDHLNAFTTNFLQNVFPSLNSIIQNNDEYKQLSIKEKTDIYFTILEKLSQKYFFSEDPPALKARNVDELSKEVKSQINRLMPTNSQLNKKKKPEISPEPPIPSGSLLNNTSTIQNEEGENVEDFINTIMDELDFNYHIDMAIKTHPTYIFYQNDDTLYDHLVDDLENLRKNIISDLLNEGKLKLNQLQKPSSNKTTIKIELYRHLGTYLHYIIKTHIESNLQRQYCKTRIHDLKDIKDTNERKKNFESVINSNPFFARNPSHKAKEILLLKIERFYQDSLKNEKDPAGKTFAQISTVIQSEKKLKKYQQEEQETLTSLLEKCNDYLSHLQNENIKIIKKSDDKTQFKNLAIIGDKIEVIEKLIATLDNTSSASTYDKIKNFKTKFHISNNQRILHQHRDSFTKRFIINMGLLLPSLGMVFIVSKISKGSFFAWTASKGGVFSDNIESIVDRAQAPPLLMRMGLRN